MGFYYRKSVSLGPFRVNVSKSGVGYSMGSRGFRTGVSCKGWRKKTQTKRSSSSPQLCLKNLIPETPTGQPLVRSSRFARRKLRTVSP